MSLVYNNLGNILKLLIQLAARNMSSQRIRQVLKKVIWKRKLRKC